MNVTSKILQKKLADDLISMKEITSLANTFLAEDNLSDAYPYVKTIALSSSNSISDKLTAGIIAVTLQKDDEAVEIFTMIIKKDPSHYEANYNLALLEVSLKKYTDAYKRIEFLLEKHPNNIELLNDLAVIATHLNNSEEAFLHWKRALELDPNNSNIRNNALAYSLEKHFYKEANQLLSSNDKSEQSNTKSKAEIHRWQEILKEKNNEISANLPQSDNYQIKGKKIAFFSSIDSFVGDIINHLKQSNEVKVFDKSNLNKMSELMDWADISWFEWCDQYIIEATKLEKKSKIVCRLHSYEAFTDFPLQVDWEKVDLLIFVNKSVQELVTNRMRIQTPQIIIHNAVDTQKFQIPKNKKRGKKIASVGYINYKKNPELLLYCFKKIHDYDNEYSLHIAGEHQDSRIKLYFDHFTKENNLPVVFDGWVDDMPKWYADKDFVISTSLFESFHYSIAEGMASGLMPLIHNWYGASYLYPEKYLFNTPDECFTMIQQYDKSKHKEIAIENRKFIVKQYSIEDKMKEISNQLYSLTTNRELTEVG